MPELRIPRTGRRLPVLRFATVRRWIMSVDRKRARAAHRAFLEWIHRTPAGDGRRWSIVLDCIRTGPRSWID